MLYPLNKYVGHDYNYLRLNCIAFGHTQYLISKVEEISSFPFSVFSHRVSLALVVKFNEFRKLG